MNSNAPGSMLGYIYQAKYALYSLLMQDNAEAEMAIEKFDDISFEENGTPVELLQTKHHIKKVSDLTDSSVDLWKTIRIWSDLIANTTISDNVTLSLITTASTPSTDTSITNKLKPSLMRNNQIISKELSEVAARSKNKDPEIQKSFNAYLRLLDIDKVRLVKAIQILDSSLEIEDISEKIRNKLQVRFNHRDPVYSRLEGWWFERVINHLKNNLNDTITKQELINKIVDIAEQFHSDSLPIDYADIEPSEKPNAITDKRQFVIQLRIIGLQNKQIEYAIRDYYRAFEQRSRWEREQLLGFDELRKYEKKLQNEWERMHLWQSYDETDENTMKTCGSELFRWAEQADIRLRPQVTEPYVMRGSFHILANKDMPHIWWHPKFIERLQQSIDLSTYKEVKESTPHEIKNLFNAAFNAYLLHEAIKGYNIQKNEGMPFALLFLVLPVILHKTTREALPRNLSTRFHNWLTKNPAVRIGFAARTRELVKYTREAIYFAMDKGYINMIEGDKFIITDKKFKTDTAKVSLNKNEVEDIAKKSLYSGRWYAKAGTISSIYVMWGIRP